MSEREVVKHPFLYRGGIAAFMRGRCQDPEVLIEGPAGTGKSRSIGEDILWFAGEYPRSRQAVIRKTRVSLTESWLVTWERKVLADGLDAYYLTAPVTEGPGRANRQGYTFRNGSEIVLGGMDNPTRLFSTEYDRIYCNEATELNEDEWESLHRALRNNVAPYQQLIGDCNPDSEYHWLNLRCNAGKTRRITTAHRDNPSLTPEYLARLEALTGVRRDRLYLGKWSSAEGAIWQDFTQSRHVVNAEIDPVNTPTKMIRRYIRVKGDTRFPNPIEVKRFIASVDWGYRDPFVMQLWAIDYDSRMWLVREIYRTQTNVNWRADRAAEWQQTYGVDSFWCDSAEPDMIQLFNQRMGAASVNPIAREANKDWRSGVDRVRQRFANDAMFIFADACQDKDDLLVEAHQPWCTVQELPGYVYRQADPSRRVKEEPEPGTPDHGCFPAGTLVATPNGARRIEDIEPGQLVETPHGACSVAESGRTGIGVWVGTVMFSNGASLTTTADHPVWTHRGWVRVDALRYGDIIGTWNPRPKSLCSMASHFAVTPRLLAAQAESISRRAVQIEGEGSSDYIKRFGLPPTVQYQPITTSTTLTKTHSITHSTILRAFTKSSTRPNCTTTSRCLWPRLRAFKKQEGSRHNGIQHQRVVNGIWNTPGRPGLAFSTCPIESALVAKPYSSQRHATLDSALLRAKPETGALAKSMSRAQYANLAVRGLCRTAIVRPEVALASVRRPFVVTGRADVFNLAVEGERVYFANGVLVSNCDALRYATMSLERSDYAPYPLDVELPVDSIGWTLGHNDLDVMV